MLSSCGEDTCLMQKLVRFLCLKSTQTLKIHFQLVLLILEKLSSETSKESQKISIPSVLFPFGTVGIFFFKTKSF